MLAAPVVGVGDFGAGEEAAAERAVGHEPDAQFARGGQDPGLHVAGPQRVFALQRRDRMHRVAAAQLIGAGFRDADRADLALVLQPAELAHRLLDRDARIDPVQIVEVDVLEPEPLQAGLHRLAGAHRRRIRAAPVLAVGELAGDDHPVPPIGHRLAEQGLIVARPIAGGGVQEGDAQFDGPVDDADGFRIIRGPVDPREAHASQPEAADGEGAELGHGLTPGIGLGKRARGAAQNFARKVTPYIAGGASD